MKKEVVVSLADLLQTINKKKKQILLFSLLAGLLVCGQQLRKPVKYSAISTLKISQQNNPSNQLIQSLSLSSQQLALTAIICYPVMEKVVARCNLQAEIATKQKFRNKLSAEWATLPFHRGPASNLLDSSIKVASKQVIEEELPTISVEAVRYEGEFYLPLTLHFFNHRQFQVLTKEGDELGVGELNQPFHANFGTFTLSGIAQPDEEFSLTLLPMHVAAMSLQKKCKIKKSKVDRSICSVSFSHVDRRLAARVANAIVEEYLRYTQKEAERKIGEQTRYFEQRQIVSSTKLADLMSSHRDYLKASDEKNLVTLEQEIHFIGERQSKILAKQEEIRKFSFATADIAPEPSTLTIESAHALLLDYEKKLEEQLIKLSHIQTTLEDIKDGKLAVNLNDPSLEPTIAKINGLQKKLLDEQNYSQKEREAYREELLLEKRYLQEHITGTIGANESVIETLEDTIESLQGQYLYLCQEEFENLERQRKDLAAKTIELPVKWLKEEQLEATKELQVESIRALAKIVETNNISFLIEPLGSIPLQFAAVPLFPDPPHILLFFIVGFVGTFLGISFLMAVKISYVGPKEQHPDLKELGLVSSRTH